MLPARIATSILTLAALWFASPAAYADDDDEGNGAGDDDAYRKAVDGPDVVLNKLFPKKGKVQLDMQGGVLLNSSYQQTVLAGGGLTYFFSEIWGFKLEGMTAINSDKPERSCVETFYNDPNFAVGEECDGVEKGAANWKKDPAGDANYGPAYVPIRQLGLIITGDVVWNPIYGKQIVLLSATNYFDFFIGMGGGIAMSSFSPKTPAFENGTPTRGTFCVKADAQAGKCQGGKNPGTIDEALTGLEGRPEPVSQTNVLIHTSIGQRYHFFKRFLVEASLEDYLLVGTDSGIDNYLTIKGGFGVRF